MPNHCYQQVHLRGPSHLIHHLHLALSKSEPEFCSTTAPMAFVVMGQGDSAGSGACLSGISGGATTGLRSGLSAVQTLTKMVLSIRMIRRLRGSRYVVGQDLGSACSCVGSSSCDGH